MINLTFRILGTSLLILSLSGCFGAGQTGAHESTPARIAKQAISAETEISPRNIVIHDIEAVDFRDSSLGCPKPGMTYLQVITPGFRVKARYKDRTFDVRIAGNQALICTPDRNLQPDISAIDLDSPVNCTSGPWQGKSCKN